MARKPSKNKATAPSRNKGGSGGGGDKKASGGGKKGGRSTPTSRAATDGADPDSRVQRRGAAVRQGRPLTAAEGREREKRRQREREEEIKAQAKLRADRQPKGTAPHRVRGHARGF